MNQLSRQLGKQESLSVREWFGRSSQTKRVGTVRTRSSVIGVLALGLILAVSSAHAEGHVAGQGFWLTLGGGAGSNRVDCDECETIDRFWGGQGYLQVGGTLSENFQIGAEIAAWHRSGEETDSTVLGLHSIAHWYPFHAGFFVKGGLGVTRVKTDFEVDGETGSGSRTGLGVELGLGWDLPIGSSFALVPTASSMISAVGGITLPVGQINNVVSTTWSVGLGLSYRPKK